MERQIVHSSRKYRIIIDRNKPDFILDGRHHVVTDRTIIKPSQPNDQRSKCKLNDIDDYDYY